MNILFATHNKSKKEIYIKGIQDDNIKVLSLDDIEIKEEIEENGKNSKENSYLKAKGYNKLSGMITVSVDDSLIIDGIPDDMQPRTNVRRVNGKKLNDEEMIEYYTSLAKRYGTNGKLNAKFEKCIAIAINQNDIFCYEYTNDIVITDKVCEKSHEGYPLDSISIVPIFNKYTVELTENESKELTFIRYSKAFDFVKETLKGKIN